MEMATEKPRIQVTLDPIVYESVRRFATLRGSPMSTVLRDMVDLVVPSFDRMSDMMQRIESEEGDINRWLLDASVDAEKHLEAMLGAVAGAQAMQATPGADATAPRPPTSNRGVSLSPDTLVSKGKNRSKQVVK
jgi:hypothetical protein